jgi:alkylated DNA repair dioxygenase AlkB
MTNVPLINGLIYKPNAITNIQITEISKDLNFVSFNQNMKFGPLPPSFQCLVNIAHSELPSNLANRVPLFNQFIANSYNVGDGIKHHVDLPRFSDGILVANLIGTCQFDFKRGNEKLGLNLNVGDVLILYGEARWDWSHGIDAVDCYRTSLTLRHLNPE